MPHGIEAIDLGLETRIQNQDQVLSSPAPSLGDFSGAGQGKGSPDWAPHGSKAAPLSSLHKLTECFRAPLWEKREDCCVWQGLKQWKGVDYGVSSITTQLVTLENHLVIGTVVSSFDGIRNNFVNYAMSYKNDVL